MGIEGTWALWNLLLSIGGAILAIVMGLKVMMVGAKHLVNKKYEDGYDQYGELRERERRGRLGMILAVPILATVAIIIFILTQNMRLPMVMTDWWTLLHGLLFAFGTVAYLLAYKIGGGEFEQTSEIIHEQLAKTIIENGLSTTTVGQVLGIDEGIISAWVRDYCYEDKLASHAEARGLMTTTPLTERELVLRVEELEREIEQKDKDLQEEKAKVEVLKETLHSFMQTQE